MRSVLSTIAADCVIISAKESVKETHEFAFLVRLIFFIKQSNGRIFYLLSTGVDLHAIGNLRD